MRKNNHGKLRVLSVLILLTAMLGNAQTGGLVGVFAQDNASLFLEIDLEAALPPTPLEPSGTYWTRDLTYRWTVVPYSTLYQYRVWDGGTKMWDKNVSAILCGSSYCMDNPNSLQLIDGTYKWQVRAYEGGVWTDWSPLKWFSIKAGFDSQFTTDSAGWQPTYGAWTWDLYNGNYRTTGILGMYSTSRYDQVYGVYTYEVKLRRQGSEMTSAYGVLFNGNPWPLAMAKRWNKGYGFYIRRDGTYAIFQYVDGLGTPLLAWTDSGGLINSGWYNSLKVTYNKNTSAAKFYINGSLVASGKLHTYKWGNVGVTMYKGFASWEQLLVDWAKLTISAPSSAAEKDATGGIIIDEASVVPENGDDTGH